MNSKFENGFWRYSSDKFSRIHAFFSICFFIQSGILHKDFCNSFDSMYELLCCSRWRNLDIFGDILYYLVNYQSTTINTTQSKLFT